MEFHGILGPERAKVGWWNLFPSTDNPEHSFRIPARSVLTA